MHTNTCRTVFNVAVTVTLILVVVAAEAARDSAARVFASWVR